MSDKVLWALTVRDGPVCFDAPGGACVSTRRSDMDEAAKSINAHWREQDPARKNKPAPWVTAKFVKEDKEKEAAMRGALEMATGVTEALIALCADNPSLVPLLPGLPAVDKAIKEALK